MRAKRCFLAGAVMFIAANLLLSGCAINLYKQNPKQRDKIKSLEATVDSLEKQRAAERKHFAEIKQMLAKEFQAEIADRNVDLEMRGRNLVITISDAILFDSGKAEIRSAAYSILDNIATVLTTEVPDKEIGVNGYTDNVSIKHSKWKSNWELSTARATDVLHYLVRKGVSPKRLSATGYGEYRPVASNTTAKGRAKNRRVEIVILPEFEKKGPDDAKKDQEDVK
ncbi:MAG: OmpA family protein [Candidatus Omnitrophota bacterium]